MRLFKMFLVVMFAAALCALGIYLFTSPDQAKDAILPSSLNTGQNSMPPLRTIIPEQTKQKTTNTTQTAPEDVQVVEQLDATIQDQEKELPDEDTQEIIDEVRLPS